MSLLKKVLRDRCGASAIEFGLILPFLAIIVVALPDVTDAAAGAINMDSAVRAGIQYAMNGGTTMASVQSFANANWQSKPSGATLSASEACYCNSAAMTCGQACTTGTAVTYVTVAASATVGGTVIKVPLSKAQSVRIQ